MKTISNKEVLDEFIGKEGSLERMEFEDELRADVLASKFKDLRKKLGLTQEQLSEKAGIGKTQISKIENGKFNLTLSTINRIAEALGVKVNFDISS